MPFFPQSGPFNARILGRQPTTEAVSHSHILVVEATNPNYIEKTPSTDAQPLLYTLYLESNLGRPEGEPSRRYRI